MSIRLGGGGGGGSGVAGWPLNFYSQGDFVGSGTAIGANEVLVAGFILEYSLKFTDLEVEIGVADAGSDSDLGIYNAAGNLVAHAGAQVIAAIGLQSFAMVEGSQTIEPGLYLLAATSVGGVLALYYSDLALVWYYNAAVAVSVGGALPAAIGAIAVSPSSYGIPFALY